MPISLEGDRSLLPSTKRGAVDPGSTWMTLGAGTYDRAMEAPLRVALALGSGGARGYAHIGAIQVLEEQGIEVVSVAGASMGALVGGLLAAGKLDDFTEWVCGLSQFDVLRLLDVSLSAPGVIRPDKLFERVNQLIGGALIEELSIAFTAVATDLLARKEVWFQRGPLVTALRASIAIPGVLTPMMLNGRLLVDGGLMDPVPMAPIASSRADITIAIDLGGERGEAAVGAAMGETAEVRPASEWVDRFQRRAAVLFDRELLRSIMSRFGAVPSMGETPGEASELADGDSLESLPVGLSKFDVMTQSLETMQSILTRYRLAGNPPDVLITVPKDACRTFDFSRATELIQLGRSLMVDAIGSEPSTTPLPN